MIKVYVGVEREIPFGDSLLAFCFKISSSFYVLLLYGGNDWYILVKLLFPWVPHLLLYYYVCHCRTLLGFSNEHFDEK